MKPEAHKLCVDCRCWRRFVRISTQPVVNIMVEIHAASALVIRNVLSKILPGSDLTQTKCGNIKGPHSTLNYLRGVSVETFLEFPKWIEVSLSI